MNPPSPHVDKRGYFENPPSPLRHPHGLRMTPRRILKNMVLHYISTHKHKFLCSFFIRHYLEATELHSEKISEHREFLGLFPFLKITLVIKILYVPFSSII